MRDNTKTKGYVALITTLVVGATSVLVTTGMLSIGITQTQSAITLYDGYKAKHLADACVEYALQEIRNSTSFTGSSTENFTEGDCTYDVSSNGGEDRDIEAEGIVGDVTQRSLVNLDQITPSINITSWEFVDIF